MATGRLFVVATPIGNLDDISARALRVLGSVSLIAAEDTRHSKRLLDHFDIRTPLTSYHDHNEAAKSEQLLSTLRDGRDVALITDAGTPCIADPGYRVVRAAREHGIPIETIPGPSAVIAALSISGLPTDRFAFHGFFPRKRNEAAAALERAREFGGTHVFYEAPNRVRDTPALLVHAARSRGVRGARALKIHEEVARHSGSGRRTFELMRQRRMRGLDLLRRKSCRRPATLNPQAVSGHDHAVIALRRGARGSGVTGNFAPRVRRRGRS